MKRCNLASLVHNRIFAGDVGLADLNTSLRYSLETNHGA